VSSDNPRPQDTEHKTGNGPPDVGSKRPIEILEARIERLEAAVEGLQDAIHRQALLSDQRLDELDRRTEPHEIARALSQDARKPGVRRAVHGRSMTCRPGLAITASAITAALSP
jgi:hypothetical protein